MDQPKASWWQGTRGEWWVVAQLILIAAIVITPRLGHLGAGVPTWARSVGVGCIGIGLIVIVLGSRTLGPNLTIWPRPRTDGRLVVRGVYRYIRHPIYSGLILCAIGVALWRESLVHLGLALLLGIVLDAKARREEQWLHARFPAYDQYRHTVRKFIPGVY